MTEQDKHDRAQMAAMIASEVLKNARDGETLVALHKHYPTRWGAFSFGFEVMCGAASAVGVMLLIGKAIYWVLP